MAAPPRARHRVSGAAGSPVPATERATNQGGSNVIRPGDRLENPVTGEVLIFHRTAEQTGGESVLVEAIVRPHGFVAAAAYTPFQLSASRCSRAASPFARRQGARGRAGRGRPCPAWHPPPLLERRRGRCSLPVRGQPRAPVRVADRDDVHARCRGQDEPQGHAEPVPASGDRPCALRDRPAAVSAGCVAARSARRRRTDGPAARLPSSGSTPVAAAAQA